MKTEINIKEILGLSFILSVMLIGLSNNVDAQLIAWQVYDD